LASKDVDGAEAALRLAAKDVPDSREAKLALAGFLTTQRSQDAADRYLASLSSDHAGDLELQLGIGDFYATAGRLKQAEAAYRKVINQDGDGPRGLKARDRVAALKLRAGDRAAAAALVREVLLANPNDADALAIRADLALAAGDPAAAVADLRTILRDQPDSVPVRPALARAHLRAGDPTLAEEALRAAIQSNPKDLAARLDLAELLVRQGKPQAALPVVEQLVADDPNNVNALLALYQVQSSTRALDEALLTAGKIKTLDPQGSLGYYVTGLAEQAKGRPADAARSFALASERAPTDPRPYQGLASAELAQGRKDAAIATLERGATATGGAPQIVTDLATLLEQAGRTDDAITRYEALLAADPRNDVAANNLAMLLVTYRKDAASLARATALAVRFKDSTNPALLDTYGWVLHASGRHEEAVAVLKKAVDRAPNVPVLQYHLGMAQLETGRKEEARTSLQAALTGQPQYNGVQEARAALAGLGAPASP
jgi:tetratricopeptide (TPR) repeat protein